MDRRSPSAVCIGHAALDLLGAVDRWPAADVKLRLRSLERQGGSPAAPAAVALRRLGTPARFAGGLGDGLFDQLKANSELAAAELEEVRKQLAQSSG